MTPLDRATEAVLDAARQMEAMLRDDYDLVTDRICLLCQESAPVDPDGVIYAPIAHAHDCAYRLLRDALETYSVVQRREQLTLVAADPRRA